MLEHFRKSLQHPPQHKFLQYQQHKVIQPPQNKIPPCAMPKSRQEPDDEQVHDLQAQPLSVTAKGNVQILPKPCPKRHMPAPPELRDTL